MQGILVPPFHTAVYVPIILLLGFCGLLGIMGDWRGLQWKGKMSKNIGQIGMPLLRTEQNSHGTILITGHPK